MLQLFNHNKILDLFPRHYPDDDFRVKLWTLSRSYEQQADPAHMVTNLSFHLLLQRLKVYS
jgi:hypothetical protein